MKLTIISLALFISLFSACSRCSSGSAIHQGGEVVGKSVSEFVKGVTGGVEKVYSVNIQLSDGKKEAGISTGKITLGNDSGGTNNKLSVYFIFDKDFNGGIQFKALDEKGLEMGRSTLMIKANKGEAHFYDIHFDKRTDINTNSTIIIQ